MQELWKQAVLEGERVPAKGGGYVGVVGEEGGDPEEWEGAEDPWIDRSVAWGEWVVQEAFIVREVVIEEVDIKVS